MPIGPFSAKEHLVISTLGLEFATAVCLLTAAGWWVDRRWNTAPWGILAGACGGFALAMYILLRALQRLRVDTKKK